MVLVLFCRNYAGDESDLQTAGAKNKSVLGSSENDVKLAKIPRKEMSVFLIKLPLILKAKYCVCGLRCVRIIACCPINYSKEKNGILIDLLLLFVVAYETHQKEQQYMKNTTKW